MHQIGEWTVFGKPGCSHRGFSFHYFLRDLWLCKTFPRHEHDLSLAFPMYFFAVLGIPCHGLARLGISRFLLGSSWQFLAWHPFHCFSTCITVACHLHGFAVFCTADIFPPTMYMGVPPRTCLLALGDATVCHHGPRWHLCHACYLQHHLYYPNSHALTRRCLTVLMHTHLWELLVLMTFDTLLHMTHVICPHPRIVNHMTPSKVGRCSFFS